MIIKVKKKHINQGYRYSAGHCPIALAIKEVIGVRKRVLVPGNSVLLAHGREYELPFKVRRAIDYFDLHGEMKPFQFRLDLSSSIAQRR